MTTSVSTPDSLPPSQPIRSGQKAIEQAKQAIVQEAVNDKELQKSLGIRNLGRKFVLGIDQIRKFVYGGDRRTGEIAERIHDQLEAGKIVLGINHADRVAGAITSEDIKSEEIKAAWEKKVELHRINEELKTARGHDKKVLKAQRRQLAREIITKGFDKVILFDGPETGAEIVIAEGINKNIIAIKQCIRAIADLKDPTDKDSLMIARTAVRSVIQASDPDAISNFAKAGLIDSNTKVPTNEFVDSLVVAQKSLAKADIDNLTAEQLTAAFAKAQEVLTIVSLNTRFDQDFANALDNLDSKGHAIDSSKAAAKRKMLIRKAFARSFLRGSVLLAGGVAVGIASHPLIVASTFGWLTAGGISIALRTSVGAGYRKSFETGLLTAKLRLSSDRISNYADFLDPQKREVKILEDIASAKQLANRKVLMQAAIGAVALAGGGLAERGGILLAEHLLDTPIAHATIDWINSTPIGKGFSNIGTTTHDKLDHLLDQLRGHPNVVTCFVAGTLILMADGSENKIEEIAAGERIISYDESSRQIAVKQVLQTIMPVNTEMVTIEFANGKQNTNTTNHPYYIKDKGWASYDPKKTQSEYQFAVAKLEINDIAYTYAEGRLQEVAVINLTQKTEQTQTYNLSRVADTHTFFANGILVHNKTATAVATGTTFGAIKEYSPSGAPVNNIEIGGHNVTIDTHFLNNYLAKLNNAHPNANWHEQSFSNGGGHYSVEMVDNSGHHIVMADMWQDSGNPNHLDVQFYTTDQSLHDPTGNALYMDLSHTQNDATINLHNLHDLGNKSDLTHVHFGQIDWGNRTQQFTLTNNTVVGIHLPDGVYVVDPKLVPGVPPALSNLMSQDQSWQLIQNTDGANYLVHLDPSGTHIFNVHDILHQINAQSLTINNSRLSSSELLSKLMSERSISSSTLNNITSQNNTSPIYYGGSGEVQANSGSYQIANVFDIVKFPPKYVPPGGGFPDILPIGAVGAGIGASAVLSIAGEIYSRRANEGTHTGRASVFRGLRNNLNPLLWANEIPGVRNLTQYAQYANPQFWLNRATPPDIKKLLTDRQFVDVAERLRGLLPGQRSDLAQAFGITRPTGLSGKRLENRLRLAIAQHLYQNEHFTVFEVQQAIDETVTAHSTALGHGRNARGITAVQWANGFAPWRIHTLFHHGHIGHAAGEPVLSKTGLLGLGNDRLTKYMGVTVTPIPGHSDDYSRSLALARAAIAAHGGFANANDTFTAANGLIITAATTDEQQIITALDGLIPPQTTQEVFNRAVESDFAFDTDAADRLGLPVPPVGSNPIAAFDAALNAIKGAGGVTPQQLRSSLITELRNPGFGSAANHPYITIDSTSAAEILADHLPVLDRAKYAAKMTLDTAGLVNGATPPTAAAIISEIFTTRYGAADKFPIRRFVGLPYKQLTYQQLVEVVSEEIQNRTSTAATPEQKVEIAVRAINYIRSIRPGSRTRYIRFNAEIAIPLGTPEQRAKAVMDALNGSGVTDQRYHIEAGLRVNGINSTNINTLPAVTVAGTVLVVRDAIVHLNLTASDTMDHDKLREAFTAMSLDHTKKPGIGIDLYTGLAPANDAERIQALNLAFAVFETPPATGTPLSPDYVAAAAELTRLLDTVALPIPATTPSRAEIAEAVNRVITDTEQKKQIATEFIKNYITYELGGGNPVAGILALVDPQPHPTLTPITIGQINTRNALEYGFMGAGAVPALTASELVNIAKGIQTINFTPLPIIHPVVFEAREIDDAFNHMYAATAKLNTRAAIWASTSSAADKAMDALTGLGVTLTSPNPSAAEVKILAEIAQGITHADPPINDETIRAAIETLRTRIKSSDIAFFAYPYFNSTGLTGPDLLKAVLRSSGWIFRAGVPLNVLNAQDLAYMVKQLYDLHAGTSANALTEVGEALRAMIPSGTADAEKNYYVSQIIEFTLSYINSSASDDEVEKLVKLTLNASGYDVAGLSVSAKTLLKSIILGLPGISDNPSRVAKVNSVLS